MKALSANSGVATKTMRDQAYSVAVRPDWAEVERLRDFVGVWIFALMRDAHMRDAVVMVTAELLENAIRHGKPGQHGIDYELRVQGGRTTIRVVNEVDPTARHFERLSERIRWIGNQPVPSTAYTRQIQNVSEGTSAGLGLTRAVCEGRSELSCAKLPGGKVEVVARLKG